MGKIIPNTERSQAHYAQACRSELFLMKPGSPKPLGMCKNIVLMFGNGQIFLVIPYVIGYFILKRSFGAK